nr:hypothetical protein [uncultured bacterium]
MGSGSSFSFCNLAGMKAADFPRVEIASRAEWRQWLLENHETSGSIWLVTWKKASGGPYVHYNDVVEEALCFGWVDGQGRGLDAERTMLLLSRRKKGSGWSKPNKERVARLREAGLMMPAGEAAIAEAIANGSWTLLDDVEQTIIPDDLAVALLQFPRADANFRAFPPSVQRAILQWIVQAKRPETRTKRIEETARLAADNIRANQWVKK